MSIKGKRGIPVKRKVVWQAFNNPDFLKKCVPGCTSLTGSLAEGYKVGIRKKRGPVLVNIDATLTFSDVVDGRRFTVTAKGKAGGILSGQGKIQVFIRRTDEGVRLVYIVEAVKGRKFAAIGKPVVESAIMAIANDFSGRLKKNLIAEQRNKKASKRKKSLEKA